MNFIKLFNLRNLFIIFIGIAIYLRIINITSEQLWEDEIIGIYYATFSWDDFWILIRNDVHPPLYYLILRGWIFLFKDSVLSVRLLSYIFSILTIPILYLLGVEIKDKKMGLIFLFLYIFNPFLIYYAIEARSYSMLHFFFSITLYYSIKCIKSSNNLRNYIFFSINGVVLIYLHYISLIYIASLIFGIFILNYKERSVYKNLIISLSIIVLSYIPWIPFIIEDIMEGPQAYTGGALSLINLLYYTFCFFIGPVPSKIYDPHVVDIIVFTFILNIPLLIITILAFIGFLYSYKNKDYLGAKNIIKYTILTTILIFGIPIIIGIVVPNSFTAKNIIGGYSLLFIILGYGLYNLFFNRNSNFYQYPKKLLRIINPDLLKKFSYPIIIILLINNIIFYPIFRANFLQKPDWDGCVKKLKMEINKHDIIIISNDGNLPPIMVYYSNLNDFNVSVKFYELTYSKEKINVFLIYLRNNHIERIWIVDYWKNIRDPDNLTESILIKRFNLQQIVRYDFRYDINLILYEFS